MPIDEFCYDLEIIKGSAGNPLILVKFKEKSNYRVLDNTWVPTLAELEFLYKTKKMMEHSMD